MTSTANPSEPAGDEVVIALTLRFSPGTVPTVLEGLVDGIAPTRAEDGNLRFEVHEVVGQPDTIVILERWRDRAALEAHWALPHAQRALALFDEHLVEPIVDGQNVLYLSDRTPPADA